MCCKNHYNLAGRTVLRAYARSKHAKSHMKDPIILWYNHLSDLQSKMQLHITGSRQPSDLQKIGLQYSSRIPDIH